MMVLGLIVVVEGIVYNKGELFVFFDVDVFEVLYGCDEIWWFILLWWLCGLYDGFVWVIGSVMIMVSEWLGVYI